MQSAWATASASIACSTLIYSLVGQPVKVLVVAGTLNALVLPLALALPQGWSIAAVVVVTQSLVELLGMLVYLRWVPRLFRD